MDKWKCVVATGAELTRHREIPKYVMRKQALPAQLLPDITTAFMSRR